jgi:hypothetical protein
VVASPNGAYFRVAIFTLLPAVSLKESGFDRATWLPSMRVMRNSAAT